jgi:hypothetical protein
MRITAQIWAPLLPSLNEKIMAACLQRDTYLDRVFAHEASMLDKEVPDPNSEEAQKMLRKYLKELRDRNPVNFNLNEATVDLIDDACQRKRIPRDSFINRVLLFLAAPQPTLFNQVYGWDLTWYFSDVIGSTPYEPPVMPWHTEGPLAVISGIISEDPFWPIRECIQRAIDDPEYSDPGYEPVPRLHAAFIRKDLFSESGVSGGSALQNALGFNCYLAPSEIAELKGDGARGIDLDELFNTPTPVPTRENAIRESRAKSSASAEKEERS